jgi:hypothetical protein
MNLRRALPFALIAALAIAGDARAFPNSMGFPNSPTLPNGPGFPNSGTFPDVGFRCPGGGHEDNAATQLDPVPQCRRNAYLVGGCYSVHGRYHVYSADGTPTIWITGTHHELGVAMLSDPRGSKFVLWMPKEIARMGGWNGPHPEPDQFDDVYADFLVCPLEKERPDAMGCVCVQSVSNVVVQTFTVQGERNLPQGSKPIAGSWSLRDQTHE